MAIGIKHLCLTQLKLKKNCLLAIVLQVYFCLILVSLETQNKCI